jgi:hypothetical protein
MDWYIVFIVCCFGIPALGSVITKLSKNRVEIERLRAQAASTTSTTRDPELLARCNALEKSCADLQKRCTELEEQVKSVHVLLEDEQRRLDSKLSRLLPESTI